MKNNREIKYRAWHKEFKKMLYLNDISSFHGTIPDISNKEDGIFHATMTWNGSVYYNGRLQNLILLQYTGLKDCNGKEIYEADIVKRNSVWEKEKNEISTIVWRGQGFWVKDEDFGWEGEDLWNWSLIEVIGNIYENKDILPKKEKIKGEIITGLPLLDITLKQQSKKKK